MQNGHNLKIRPSQRGLPRFPSDTDDGYAGAGPVTVYRLTPEELAKYGPVPVQKQKAQLTKVAVKWAVEHAGSLAEAAKKLCITEKQLKFEMNRHVVAIPNGWKEVDKQVESLEQYSEQHSISECNEISEPVNDILDVDYVQSINVNDSTNKCNDAKPKRTRLEIARENLSKEEYLKLKNENMTDSKIKKLHKIAADVLTSLKKEWGLIPTTSNPPVSKPAVANPPVSKPADITPVPTGMSVSSAIKLQEELIEDIDGFKRILDGHKDFVSGRVSKTIRYQLDNCQKTLDYIKKIFDSTMVQL